MFVYLTNVVFLKDTYTFENFICNKIAMFLLFKFVIQYDS